MPKRILQGPVVSDKGDKTVVVRIDRSFLHPLLRKVVRRSKRYHAHDEENQYKVGDRVMIRECPPKSKLKRWEVVTEDQLAAEDKAKTSEDAA
jgi:small subunit ribosomal protein S17